MPAMRIRTVIIAATTAVILAGCGDAHKDKIEMGQMVYERSCVSCHSTGVGPNLSGVMGRKVASVEGFDYSDAMKKSASDVWTEDRMKNYLMGPLQMYPEGRMVITPLTPEEADAVIAFIKDRYPAQDGGEEETPPL